MVFSTVFHYLKTKCRPRFKSVNELVGWQDRKVTNFIRSIISKSTFYSDLYKNCDISNWSSLPIIDKEIMMLNFDTLNTRGIKKEEAFQVALESEKSRDFVPSLGEITVGMSSGTSGKRGLFIVHPSEKAAWAGMILAKVLPQSILFPCKIALFLRANNNLYSSTQSNKIQFRFFDLFVDLEKYIDDLNVYQPDLLVAPASVLKLLAKEFNKKNLQIKPVKIISVAEVLYDHDRDFIEKSFGQKLHQIYQATEGFLATTCPYGTLHINEDSIVVQEEWLDQEKTRFNPIVTDFRRTSQPIIRYRMNDVLVLRKDKCPCGSVFKAIEKIEGRCDDILYFENVNNTKSLQMIFPDFFIRAFFTLPFQLNDYRIIQTSSSRLEVHLPESELTEEQLHLIKNTINALLVKKNCILPQIQIYPLTKHTLCNKVRLVERKWKIQ